MVTGVCSDLVRLVREAPGTLDGVARRAGVSRASLARLLRGERVGTGVLEAIARELGFDVAITIRRDREAVTELAESTP